MGADQNLAWTQTAASALEWWREAGVDTLVDETPRHWLNVDSAKNASVDRRAHGPAAPAQPPVVFPETLAAFEAWRLSDAAPDAGWPGDRVGAQGNRAAALAVIIEMPEREDGDSGVLLSGAAGRLFDRMLAAIGHDRQSIYLVPMCVARPMSGRIAPDIEAALAAALRHQLALAAPQRALIFGNAASRALIGAEIQPSRGNLHPINHGRGETMAVTCFHPRLLLERPAAKAEAWKDLQRLTRGIYA